MRPTALCAITWLQFVPASLLSSDRYFWYSVSAGGSLYQGADLTQDEGVTLRDYAVLAREWRRTDCSRTNLWCRGADFNRSGAVDGNDLAYLANHWLRPPTPAYTPAKPVPPDPNKP